MAEFLSTTRITPEAPGLIWREKLWQRSHFTHYATAAYSEFGPWTTFCDFFCPA
jgi:hypothetical protein